MADTSTTPSTPTTIKPRLGPNYRKVYIATALSNIGDGMATIAYPWLASAITRNPLLVGLIAVAQRLPWMIFSLPAGVITDRNDRRKLMVSMDMVRCGLTFGVAGTVLWQQNSLPLPDELDSVTSTRVGLYLVLLVATLLLGFAEVLRDNSNQTFLPSIVAPEHLERANGRIWSIEGIANTFIGPPLGTLLLGVAFSFPFFIDGASFFAAAALVASIPGSFQVASADDNVASWRAQLAEGLRWLWNHHLLRAMAIILGLINMANYISGATFVLFAQEVLGTSKEEFTLMGFGFAVGGILGGYFAPWMSKRYGPGTCLAITLLSGATVPILVGFTSWWPLAGALFAIQLTLGTMWNVITVSFRQSIIPSHMLGRVNSAYRFFGWGMMPIGAAIGGLVAWTADQFTTRETALRWPFFIDGLIGMAVFVAGRRLLTTSRMDAARANASPDSPEGAARTAAAGG